MTKTQTGYSMAHQALWYAHGYIEANRRCHHAETHGHADMADERYRHANATRYFCAMGLETQVGEWCEEFGGGRDADARLAAAKRMNNAANQLVERDGVTFVTLFDLRDAVIDSYATTADCIAAERARIAATRAK